MKNKKDVKEAPRNLLKELCGSDSALYEYLSRNLYETPMIAISNKDLEALIQIGEESGNFGPAVDKAVFENAQNPGQQEKYIAIVRSLASKAIAAAEREKAEQEKQGNMELAASLDARMEQQTFLSERAEDILDTAAKFYAEKMLELGESNERKERALKKSRAENEEQVMTKREVSRKKERKRELKKMGRKERKEAKAKDKLEHQEAEQRKVVREQERQLAAEEELKIQESEKKDRDVRHDKRMEA